MPFLFSERLPLPSLRSYALLSVVFLVSGLLQAGNQSEAGENQDYDDPEQPNSANVSGSFIGKESFFAWSVINMAYCGLFLIGKLIQRFVFGDLRLIEEQHLQEKFWNYVFYKVIFVFGVINAQTLNEVMQWIAWFSMVGFWKIFGQICTDRFDYIMSSPNASNKKHTRLLCLLFSIMISTICMSIAAYYSELAKNWNIFGFMLAECILLGLECLHMITKYGIQFSGDSNDENWEHKAMIVYYVDFTFQFIIHGIDLLHHFHMLFWSNVFLSMASLVLYWNIRTIFSNLKRKFKKYQMYKKVTRSIQDKFEFMNEEDLEEYEDNCAICWDSMKAARKLGCGHIFHQSCLCSWLQQDTSCPTCRISLANVIDLPERQAANHILDGEIDQRQFADLQAQGNQRNHFFHFDGSRIANWFPSFSIEVFHGANETADLELEEMAIQVHSMFPTIPYDAILDDVRRTQSPELTAENILEGNIFLPNTEIEEDDSEPAEEDVMPDERPLQSIAEENASQEPIKAADASNAAPSESESSDAGSCVEFYEQSEKRQSTFQNRRQKMMADARRRFTNKSIEQHGRNNKELATQPKSNNSVQKNETLDHEERRARVLQAVERRLRTDEQR